MKLITFPVSLETHFGILTIKAIKGQREIIRKGEGGSDQRKSCGRTFLVTPWNYSPLLGHLKKTQILGVTDLGRDRKPLRMRKAEHECWSKKPFVPQEKNIYPGDYGFCGVTLKVILLYCLCVFLFIYCSEKYFN